jgi:hypothetical protein
MQSQRASNSLGGRLLAHLWLAAVAVIIIVLYVLQKNVKESESVLQRLQSIEQRLAGHVANATQSHSQQSSSFASLLERVDSRLSTADQQSNDHVTKVKQHARTADSIHQRQEELQKNLEQQVKDLGQHVQQEKQHLEQQEKLQKQSSVLQLNQQQKEQQKEQQTKKDEKPPCATDRRVVVSLSTFSHRADYVPPTIYSLTNQKCRPNKIYLWVPMTVSFQLASIPCMIMLLPSHAAAAELQPECTPLHSTCNSLDQHQSAGHGFVLHALRATAAAQAAHAEAFPCLLTPGCCFTQVNRFNETVKEMPGHAKAMQDQFQGLVETRSSEDYGPSTKLLPTLKVSDARAGAAAAAAGALHNLLLIDMPSRLGPHTWSHCSMEEPCLFKTPCLFSTLPLLLTQSTSQISDRAGSMRLHSHQQQQDIANHQHLCCAAGRDRPQHHHHHSG